MRWTSGQELMRRIEVLFQQRRGLVPAGSQRIHALQRPQPVHELRLLCPRDVAKFLLIDHRVEVCRHNVEVRVVTQELAAVRKQRMLCESPIL